MSCAQQELYCTLAAVSSGNLPDELPPDMVCRRELTGIIDRQRSLTDEIALLRGESVCMKNRFDDLVKQEFIYRSVFEKSVLGIIIVATDSKIINANQAIEYMLGYMVDELKEMSISDLVLPESHQERMHVLRLLIMVVVWMMRPSRDCSNHSIRLNLRVVVWVCQQYLAS